MLGVVTEVDPRQVWPNEARDFTPWLCENIELLSRALALDLEITGTEVSVCTFTVDMVGRELGSRREVVIENQLGPTDHLHLGQLLTYAAGHSAGIVVWVATQFREEHQRVLHWLNETTGEELAFFGVEVKVVAIDDSKPAPLFTVAAKPAEWTSIRSVTRRGERYRDFWSRYLAELKSHAPHITRASRGFPQNWCSVGIGRSGFSLVITFTQDRRFRVELLIDLGDEEENLQAYHQLLSEREALEAELGESLSWEELGHARSCRVALYSAGSHSIMDGDDQLAELRRWAIENTVSFHRVFAKRVKALRLHEE